MIFGIELNLKCTFRRYIDGRLMQLWLEIRQLASTIVFSEEEDAFIWHFNSNSNYSRQSLYKVINFKGVVPVYVPAVWRLKVPPRIYFLWLLSKNKLLTRDNLSRRKKLMTSLVFFWYKEETVHHLFFYCAIASQLWSYFFELFGNVGNNFLSIGQMWLSSSKFIVCNMFGAAALWGIWKL